MQLPSFLNTERKLRNISWITIILFLIVPPTLSLGLVSERVKFALTILGQSISIITRTTIRQIARSFTKRSLTDR